MYEINDIAYMLEANGFGTVGEDIYIQHAPPESNKVILVTPSNDPPLIDAERPTYYVANFQVIVREIDYAEGRDISRRIGELLTQHNIETQQMKVKQMRPMRQARVYRRSESGSIEFSLTFKIQYVQKEV